MFSKAVVCKTTCGCCINTGLTGPGGPLGPRVPLLFRRLGGLQFPLDDPTSPGGLPLSGGPPSSGGPPLSGSPPLSGGPPPPDGSLGDLSGGLPLLGNPLLLGGLLSLSLLGYLSLSGGLPLS